MFGSRLECICSQIQQHTGDGASAHTAACEVSQPTQHTNSENRAGDQSNLPHLRPATEQIYAA